jgi:single-strand DNA-binding protein
MSLARATVSGTVLTDPEKRFTSNNLAVSNFTMQVAPASMKDQPFTVKVTCWRNLAESVALEVRKGQTIVVEGRLQVAQYDSPGGIARRSYELDATNVFFGQLQALNVSGPGAAAPQVQPQQASGSFQQHSAPAVAPVQQPQLQPMGASTSSVYADDLENDIPF